MENKKTVKENKGGIKMDDKRLLECLSSITFGDMKNFTDTRHYIKNEGSQKYLLEVTSYEKMNAIIEVMRKLADKI